MCHPESKSTPTFSDFPLLLGLWPRQIFKTGDQLAQKLTYGWRMEYAGRCTWVFNVQWEVLVQIVLANSEIWGPEH